MYYIAMTHFLAADDLFITQAERRTMILIQEDIEKNPDDYDINESDINIDFRRVKNLKVYFSHTAISLTTDISNVGEWQGGIFLKQGMI